MQRKIALLPPYGDLTGTEILFPIRTSSLPVLRSLFSSETLLSGSDFVAKLHNRMNSLPEPAKEFAEWLLQLHPHSLLIVLDEVWLRLDYVHHRTSSFFIRVAEPAGHLRDDVGPHADLHNFLTLMDGFCEHVGVGGTFCADSERSLAEDMTELKEWVGASFIFTSSTSDSVCFREGLGFGWWTLAGLSVQPLCSDLREFLRIFVQHVEEFWSPFSAYPGGDGCRRRPRTLKSPPE